MKVPQEAFETGVLDPIKHERFVLKLEKYAARAGIAPKYLWTAAKPLLTEGEIDYLRNVRRVFNENGTVGLCYVGLGENAPMPIVERFSVMVGALVRGRPQGVDARLMSVQDIVDTVHEGDLPDATVLFIPGLLGNEFRKTNARRVDALADVLIWRAARGKQTVVHVDDPKLIRPALGSVAAQVIAASMVQIDF